MPRMNKYCWSILLGLSLLFGLWTTTLQSYLLFHCLAEIFSIIVAFCIFILAWNSRRFAKNSYLLFIGIAYLFIGVLDLTHTLAYKGMGVFLLDDPNLSTQLWIAARYVESASLLIAAFLVGRKLKVNFAFIGYILITAVLLGSIFYWNIFPICYVEGDGLTTFKIVSEYIISFILIASIITIIRKRHKFDKSVLQLLIASIVVTIVSELAFTMYIDVYGFSNFIGHYLKIISFYLIYKAIIETGLTKPFAVLFRELKQSENTLKMAKDNLELEVDERTAELRKSVKSLQEAQLSYRTVADFTYDWEYWKSPDGTFRYVSPSCERITGYKPEEFMNNPELFRELILPEDKTRWEEHHQEALKEKDLQEIQFRIHKQDGQVRWIEHTCQPVKDTDGEFMGFRASNRDITKRKQAEEAIQKSQDSLRYLAGKLLTAQEEERRLLAREMHDDFTQRLAILAIEAGKLETESQQNDSPMRAKLQEMKKKIIKLSKDIHDISRQIHPAILDDLGLADAIKSECNTFTQREEIHVECKANDIPSSIPRNVAICIYRITQESLRNIAKHAETDKASVSLIGRDGNLFLTVRDNGIGFDAKQIHGQEGIGITSMQERVRLIEGEFSLQSKPGEGTVIKVIAPYTKEQE